MRVKNQLNIALEIDEIEGQIDFFLGKILSQTQQVYDNKNCFSLPEFSYFIFLMLKTNVIAKPTKFFEGLFAFSSESFSKEYIIFNYTLFTSPEFVQSLLKKSKKAELAGLKNTGHEIFIKDFSLNFSIMLDYYKNTTEFGTADTGIQQKSVGIAESLLNLILTNMDGILQKLKDKSMKYVVDYITEAITGALGFLSAIPGAENAIKAILEVILSTIIEYITIFYDGATQYFHREHESEIKNQIFESQRNDMLLNFDMEIEKLLFKENDKVEFNYSKFDSIKDVENKYLKSMDPAGSVFNKIQRLNIFKDKDYNEKALKIYKNAYERNIELD
jgi:hypothetical protein